MKRLGPRPTAPSALGIVHYNTADEVDRLLAELRSPLDPAQVGVDSARSRASCDADVSVWT